jgi:hypothetical protein
MKIMIPVEIKPGSFQTLTSKAGKPYSKQVAWVDLGKSYPSEVAFMVDKEILAGKYVLDESCVFVNRNGDLSFSFRSMKPVAAAAAQAVAR